MKGDALETGRKDPSEEEMRLVWGASPRAWQLANTGCESPMHCCYAGPWRRALHGGVGGCTRGIPTSLLGARKILLQGTRHKPNA